MKTVRFYHAPVLWAQPHLTRVVAGYVALSLSAVVAMLKRDIGLLPLRADIYARDA